MNVVIIGTGYVGLVTGVSMAGLGHAVVCIGRDEKKIAAINQAHSPFFEPGLDDLLKKVVSKNQLHASGDLARYAAKADIIIIGVGTPTKKNRIDLSAIKIASRQIGEALRGISRYQVVVVKSTVVPGTTESVIKPIVEKYAKRDAATLGFCMNPEFLREGNAVSDALNPDRIVIGQQDEKSGKTLARMYRDVKTPKVFVNLRTAEMTKYAANALFSTLISYSNDIARISEAVGDVDVLDVWKGVHMDGRLSPRVGNKRIRPGVLNFILSGCGYGGSCFPKDTKALAQFAKGQHAQSSMVESTIAVNKKQPLRLLSLLEEAIPVLAAKRIAVLGLAFKPNTDDVRESPALPVIEHLLKKGARVVCHDPEAYKKQIPRELAGMKVQYAKTAREALKQADGAIVVTSWDEYRALTGRDFVSLMKSPIVIDGRRIYDKDAFRRAGVVYKGIGLSG